MDYRYDEGRYLGGLCFANHGDADRHFASGQIGLSESYIEVPEGFCPHCFNPKKPLAHYPLWRVCDCEEKP